jgi:hypothetical protein
MRQVCWMGSTVVHLAGSGSDPEHSPLRIGIPAPCSWTSRIVLKCRGGCNCDRPVAIVRRFGSGRVITFSRSTRCTNAPRCAGCCWRSQGSASRTVHISRYPAARRLAIELRENSASLFGSDPSPAGTRYALYPVGAPSAPDRLAPPLPPERQPFSAAAPRGADLPSSPPHRCGALYGSHTESALHAKGRHSPLRAVVRPDPIDRLRKPRGAGARVRR